MHINSNIHCIIGIIGILTIVMALLPLSTISLISFIGFFIPALSYSYQVQPNLNSIQFHASTHSSIGHFLFLIYFAMGLFHPFRYSKYVTTCFLKTFMNMFFTPHSHPLSNLLLLVLSWLFVDSFSFFFVFHMFAFQGVYLQACLMHPPSFFFVWWPPIHVFPSTSKPNGLLWFFSLSFFFFVFTLFCCCCCIHHLVWQKKKLLLLKKKKKRRIAWSWEAS